MENTQVINVADTQRPDETPEQFSERLTRYASVAMGDVVPEVMRMTAKYPFDLHPGDEALTDLFNELWDISRKNPHGDRHLLRKEALHAAAMAIRFIAELT